MMGKEEEKRSMKRQEGEGKDAVIEVPLRMVLEMVRLFRSTLRVRIMV